MKIAVSTSSFGLHSQKPIEIIKKKGWSIFLNPYKRTLKKEEVGKFINDADGLLAGVECLDDEVLSSLNNIKVISRIGVGTDNIDFTSARKKRIKVYKTETTPALAVAELVLGMAISLSRNIIEANEKMKLGIWEKKMGTLLYGKKLGIIGLGAIGKTLAKVSKGLNFDIYAFDKNIDHNFRKENNINYISLEQIMEECDIISIHLSLNHKTRNLINKEMISKMKKNAIIINASRGGIVDENELFNALEGKRIGGAALDVYNYEPYKGPLSKLDNIIMTPHIGSYAKEIRIAMEIEAAENLIRGFNAE